MIGLTFTTTGIGSLPVGSEINVSQRYFRNSNPIQAGFTGGTYGGGGLIGGGTPSLVVDVDSMVVGTTGNQPAGGGGGQYGLNAGAQNTFQRPGDAPLAFKNNLNRVGYGNGATGTGTPGSQYLVLEQQIINPTLGSALTVIGGSTFSDVVYINGANNALQIPNGSLIAAGVQASTSSGFTNVVSGVSAQAIFPLGLTSNAGCSVGALTLVAGGTAQNFYAPPGTLQTFGRVNIVGDPASGPSVGYALTVSGVSGSSFASDAYGSDFIIRSDYRLKENIVTIDSALDKVVKMRGVYFNKLNETTRRIGVIAQEVEQVLPEVVHTDDSPDQMKAVSYANIVGLLIEAIKELKEMIKVMEYNTK
jgi:hypothetical protein